MPPYVRKTDIEHRPYLFPHLKGINRRLILNFSKCICCENEYTILASNAFG